MENARLIWSNKEAYQEIKKFANYAVNEIANERRNKTNESRLRLQLIRIINAEKQVVSGINYFLKLRLKEANCRTDCITEVCDVRVCTISPTLIQQN